MISDDLRKAQVSLRRAEMFREGVVTGIIKAQSRLFLLMGQLRADRFQ